MSANSDGNDIPNQTEDAQMSQPSTSVLMSNFERFIEATNSVAEAYANPSRHPSLHQWVQDSEDTRQKVSRMLEPIKCQPLDTRISWRQLIVIGNGFDLECDLPSEFENFFDPRYDVITHAEEERSSSKQPWGAYLTAHGITVWDIILQAEKKKYWYDVERAIADWVAPHQKEDEKEKEQKAGKQPTPIMTILANLKELLEQGHYTDNGSPKPYCAIKDATSGKDGVLRFILDNVSEKAISKWAETEIYGYFFKELNRLEREFGTYLQGVVDADVMGYKDRATRLLIDLIKDERVSEEDYVPEESFLSFNYTHPISVLTVGKEGSPIPMVNVHGRLGDEIVFGIDGSDCLSDSNALRFTKTYRLMGLGNPELGKLMHGRGRGPVSSVADSTDMIKFYGHSLSDPDYSYFQAIFDTVGLYDGNTTVIFYYRPWKQDDGTRVDEQVARSKMMDKVVRLLNSYGQSMENKAHGRNLLHKLLIEGRLKVKLLPKLNIRKSFTDANGVEYV